MEEPDRKLIDGWWYMVGNYLTTKGQNYHAHREFKVAKNELPFYVVIVEGANPVRSILARRGAAARLAAEIREDGKEPLVELWLTNPKADWATFRGWLHWQSYVKEGVK